MKKSTHESPKHGIRKILSILGPGFITGASDDDPSGIGTYSQTGAQFGFHQLWTALFFFPFMTVVQEMCGRIGLCTGKGLAGVIKQHYPRPVLYISVLLLTLANVINIGADLGAMAASTHEIIHFPLPVLLVSFTALCVLLEVFVSYKTYSRLLKYLTFSLFAYIMTAFIIHMDWSNVVYATFIPRFEFSKDYFLNIVAILGTTISPYLFFWQASEEVEEEVEKGKIRVMGAGIPRVYKREVKEMRIDTIVGMFFSQLIMWFIIVTTAATLHTHGITNIETADQAAKALQPIAGKSAFLLFALGIVGTGMLAIPVLAGSISYALSETLKLKEGLYRDFRKAWGFYLIIAVATLIGLGVNFTTIKPFTLLYYSAVLNGLVAPPLLVIILLITSNKEIMGTHANPKPITMLGWVITAIMTVAGVAMLIVH